MPLAAPTGCHNRVLTNPLDTLLLEHKPPSILHFVQAEDTGFTINLPATRTLGAGFEVVSPVS